MGKNNKIIVFIITAGEIQNVRGRVKRECF